MKKVDVVKQLVSYYPDDLAWATTADQIEEAFASGDHADHYHDYNNDDDNQVELRVSLVWSQVTPLGTALQSSGHFTGGVDMMMMMMMMIKLTQLSSSSFSISRMGARYMTLTHSCNTPWAEAAQMEDGGQGLSDFGEKVG